MKVNLKELQANATAKEENATKYMTVEVQHVLTLISAIKEMASALERAKAEMQIVLENNKSVGTLSPLAIQAALKAIESDAVNEKD